MTLPSIRPAPFFVLRTPLLPFDTWLDLWQSCSALQDEPGEDLEIARRQLRPRLLELLAVPEVRLALWLASPDFLVRLENGF
jgi:hypothetical protein